MVELRLVSQYERPLKPLIEAALANEVRLLEVGIRQTQQRLTEFESRYSMSSDEFKSRFEDDNLDETLDYIEWVGETRLLQRLKDKVAILREIQFAN